MLDSLGYVPSRDQTPEVLYGGYRFQITQMDGALPLSVRIWKQTEPQESSK